jgi:hypothetical protein
VTEIKDFYRDAVFRSSVEREVVNAMTAGGDMSLNRKKFLAVVRRPAFFLLINFFLVNTLFALLPHGLGDIGYNAGRICIILYGGWLVVRRKLGNAWHAASVGIVLYFIDHVVLKGGVFLLNYLFKPDGPGLAAFSGVIASFILFIPLAMLVGAMGGLFARIMSEKTPADQQ